MQHNFTITKASGQPRKPRNQAEFRSVYIADLTRAAEANGTLSNLSNVPELPIRRPTSRTGRKALQRTFDADCRRLRREAGVPAVSGPPIPGSEHNGHRRFYTLEQCRQGQRLSAIARRDQALPRWLQIQTLHYRRHSLRDIAAQIGMSASQVHRVVAGRLWREAGDEDGAPEREAGDEDGAPEREAGDEDGAPEREAGDEGRSPSGMVVNSARGTPRKWTRVLALNEIYRSRCLGDGKLLKRLTARQGAYLRGVVKNRGPDYAAAAVEATERYVLSLAHLDVQLAVQRLNQDSGYQPAAGTYHAATFWQRREPSSTACEDGGS